MESIWAEAKSMRLLAMYGRLMDGKVIRKKELVDEFGVTQRSVQRDLESLRIFFADEMRGREIVYDSRERGYRLNHVAPKGLSNSEILAVCKILLESRSMTPEEMMPILDKLLDCCVPDTSKKAVTKLIANERFHYIPPRHGKKILPGLWEIGQAVEQHRVMEIEYVKMGGDTTNRVIEPVGLMFSEYYFYLVAFIRNEPYTAYAGSLAQKELEKTKKQLEENEEIISKAIDMQITIMHLINEIKSLSVTICNGIYKKLVFQLKDLVSKKKDYNLFTDAEKQLVGNNILLVKILNYLNNIPLYTPTKYNSAGEIEEVEPNFDEVKNAITLSKNKIEGIER